MNGEGNPKLIVGLGEILWDLLPSGPQLGGAVSNYAVMAGRLGDHAVCASRVGQDAAGERARERLCDLPVDPSLLQTDPLLPTGSVSVAFDSGQPEYVIHHPAAWDSLELTEHWLDLASRADAVCFGTLAQRDLLSRRTIEGFLAATSPGSLRIFDVNLRPPFFSAETLQASLALATVVKMNETEMPQVLSLLGMPWTPHRTLPESLAAGAHRLLDRFPMDMVCITLGGNGSLLVTREQIHEHPGIPVRVVDTVGAGDAFAAALTHYRLRGAPLPVLNEAGNRWGSWVASQPGATPALDPATHDSITRAISLANPA